MLTWRKGEEVMDAARLEFRERTQQFIELLRAYPPVRIPGTAIVLGRMAAFVGGCQKSAVCASKGWHEPTPWQSAGFETASPDAQPLG